MNLNGGFRQISIFFAKNSQYFIGIFGTFFKYLKLPIRQFLFFIDKLFRYNAHTDFVKHRRQTDLGLSVFTKPKVVSHSNGKNSYVYTVIDNKIIGFIDMDGFDKKWIVGRLSVNDFLDNLDRRFQ